MKPSDYVYIKAWGDSIASCAGYIREEQERAAAENAPVDAWSKDHGDRRWRRFSELPKDHPLRTRLEYFRHGCDWSKVPQPWVIR